MDKPVVEMRNITKRFLDVTAVDRVSFTLYPGEVCALLGENGAGKTTLMNILFGYYTCDEGEIYIKQEEVNLNSPRDAINRGIGMIHQHFTLVPSQSVIENIIIGSKYSRGFFLDLKSARERLLELQKRFGLEVNPDTKVWTLSVGEQQKVEILKALYRDVDILIMDEPTSVLALEETKELFKTLRSLSREGKSVVFISHKLNEVMEISDRIVVLRNGRVTAERVTSQTNQRELANLMVGREVLERIEKKIFTPGEPVLEIKGLTVLNDRGLEAIKGINLVVRRYEILGIAGVSGNGQKELAEVLFGVRVPREGNIKVNGKTLTPGDPLSVISLGIGRIPEDRIEMGLLMDLSVEENLILEKHISADFRRFIMMNFPVIKNFSEELIREYSIRTSGREAAVKSLSGGNLQKVILARELYGNPALLIASQPTRGLDVGAMEYVHQRILEAQERGAGVMLISEDLDEIFTLSDRIVVLYEGEIIGEVKTKEATREQIGLWMSGVRR
ncbi:MAG: ABC transporter ATP-binding protein [Spirochaetota bacterium]